MPQKTGDDRAHGPDHDTAEFIHTLERKSFQRKSLALNLTLWGGFFCFAVLGFFFLSYPKTWKELRQGQSSQDVLAHLAASSQKDLTDLKGDFYESNFGLIRWSLQVIYNPKNELEAAHLKLFLGSRSFFKSFYIADLAQ